MIVCHFLNRLNLHTWTQPINDPFWTTASFYELAFNLNNQTWVLTLERESHKNSLENFQFQFKCIFSNEFSRIFSLANWLMKSRRNLQIAPPARVHHLRSRIINEHLESKCRNNWRPFQLRLNLFRGEKLCK